MIYFEHKSSWFFSSTLPLLCMIYFNRNLFINIITLHGLSHRFLWQDRPPVEQELQPEIREIIHSSKMAKIIIQWLIWWRTTKSWWGHNHQKLTLANSLLTTQALLAWRNTSMVTCGKTMVMTMVMSNIMIKVIMINIIIKVIMINIMIMMICSNLWWIAGNEKLNGLHRPFVRLVVLTLWKGSSGD